MDLRDVTILELRIVPDQSGGSPIRLTCNWRALLERPVRPETLLSTVQNALRARFRQYQVRDYVRPQRRQAHRLRTGKQKKSPPETAVRHSLPYEIRSEWLPHDAPYRLNALAQKEFSESTRYSGRFRAAGIDHGKHAGQFHPSHTCQLQGA